MTEQSAAEGAVVAKKATELLKKGEAVQLDELVERICSNDEQREQFAAFRQEFEEDYGGFAEEVNVVAKAASRKPVTRMNILRIGDEFEVKVLNPEARIETGEDKSGKWWKLYS